MFYFKEMCIQFLTVFFYSPSSQDVLDTTNSNSIQDACYIWAQFMALLNNKLSVTQWEDVLKVKGSCHHWGLSYFLWEMLSDLSSQYLLLSYGKVVFQ